MIREISISNGFPVILLPLGTVLLISGVKDLFEDYKRHKSDRAENYREVEKLSTSGFVPGHWHELHPGDVVRVKKNEFFPADLVLLTSSEEHGGSGECYIETKSLDGETNLKRRIAPKEIHETMRSAGSEKVSTPASSYHHNEIL